MAERLAVDDLVAAADDDDGAGRLPGGNGLVDEVGDARQAGGVEAGRSRRPRSLGAEARGSGEDERREDEREDRPMLHGSLL